MIPKDSLSQVDEQLQQFQIRFWSKVDDFEELYEVARDEARGVLKELFQEDEYPVRIRSKFNFEWRYLALGVPTRTTILTPAIYEREKEKFQKLMDETRELAVIALREEFSEIVTHLVERLDSNSNGKGKTISSTMFNKLHQFIDDLGSKNLFGDAELTELAEQAKAAIRGVNPSGVKYSDTIRERLNNQMSNIKTIIDSSIEDMPRRKLRLETPPPFEMPLPMAMAG
jgi:N-methylhydantoinase A/oxoprolinase/acetone carboxylase beta subunit